MLGFPAGARWSRDSSVGRAVWAGALAVGAETPGHARGMPAGVAPEASVGGQEGRGAECLTSSPSPCAQPHLTLGSSLSGLLARPCR